MRDKSGKIIYVGKALSLKSRLRSYFSNSRHTEPKVISLIKSLHDFEFIVTESEQEALILESNLIKAHRPRFNSRLKDDKSYPFIKIDVSEDFPQVYITRNVKKEKDARYFGPFASAGSVRKTLKLLKKLFPYRSCTKAITGKDERACLDFHINRCVGPCIGAADKKEYLHIIEQVILFLEGQTSHVVNSLRDKMLKSAEELQFETAASLRDQIRAIEKVHEGQKVLTLSNQNMDVIACSQWSSEAWVEIFFVRHGKLVGRDNYLMQVGQDDNLVAVQEAFMKQFYEFTPYIPPLILTQLPNPAETKTIEEFLTNKTSHKVRIQTPMRGEKKNLINMVIDNANEGINQLQGARYAEMENNNNAMVELQEALHLPTLPKRIECYDISNTSGKSSVGSMVVFQDGHPKSSEYRRFSIRTVPGIDDYSMMKEMLSRRFKRMNSDTDGTPKMGNKHYQWTKKPDLVLIDGGKGHLGASLQVLFDMGIEDIAIASIAKKKEELFVPETPEAITLPRNSHGLFLLQRARDEAHRFAITYHRNKRSRNAIKSSLDLIPGIGPKKRRALLKHFGSVKGIKSANLEEIASIPGMTLRLASKIQETL